MINTEQLRELQAEFEPTRLANQSKYKKLEKLRRIFERCFPHNRISQLKLDNYVQGKGSKKSFCYWVEWKLADLGNIQRTPTKKFGVYYSKKKNSFQFTKEFQNRENPFGAVLNEITSLLDAAEKNDIARVQSAKISPMFKGKLLFLYFPKRFLNIYSERHIDHFLSQLRLGEPESNLDLISKRELLVKLKSSDEVMKDWRMFEFHDFLYGSQGDPPSRDLKVTPLLKDYVLNLPLPEETEPEFISLKPGNAVESSEKTSDKKSGTIDYEQKNRRNKLTGNQGEDVVFLAEKRELRKNGKPDLAKKVEAICRNGDGAGYDILSFELDGTPKQIEVKSTTARPPNPNSSFGFYLSSNEYEQARTLANYYLYIVFDVKSKRPKIWRIKNPASPEPKKLNLKPTSYFATLTVVENDIRHYGLL
ncbi:MAG TPA: DUF3883 domain-containing protein [Verrucomicrobiae bacterium]